MQLVQCVMIMTNAAKILNDFIPPDLLFGLVPSFYLARLTITFVNVCGQKHDLDVTQVVLSSFYEDELAKLRISRAQTSNLVELWFHSDQVRE